MPMCWRSLCKSPPTLFINSCYPVVGGIFSFSSADHVYVAQQGHATHGYIYTGDALSAQNLQGGLVQFWKHSCVKHLSSNRWMRPEFERLAPDRRVSSCRLRRLFESRCYPLTQIEDYVDEVNGTGKWAQFRMIDWWRQEGRE